MKKVIMALSLALVVGLFSIFGYADGSLDGIDPYEDSMKEYFRPWEEDYEDSMKEHSRPWGEDIVQYEENAMREAGERSRLIEKQAKIGNENYRFNKKDNYSRRYCSNRFSLNS